MASKPPSRERYHDSFVPYREEQDACLPLTTGFGRWRTIVAKVPIRFFVVGGQLDPGSDRLVEEHGFHEPQILAQVDAALPG